MLVAHAAPAGTEKHKALLEELHNMREEDPSAKAIVFSQFVAMLDLIEFRLQRAGVRVVKLNGGMNLAQRDGVLGAFKEDPDVRVILISLKAGGVALNLTVASCIFLMDPWWNPAAEYQAPRHSHRATSTPRLARVDLWGGGLALSVRVAPALQAIDRAHRLGQHKPIRAVRFVVRNTVEERILRLQDKKRLVFEGTVGGSAACVIAASPDVPASPSRSTHLSALPSTHAWDAPFLAATGDAASLSQLSEDDLRFLFQN